MGCSSSPSFTVEPGRSPGGPRRRRLRRQAAHRELGGRGLRQPRRRRRPSRRYRLLCGGGHAASPTRWCRCSPTRRPRPAGFPRYVPISSRPTDGSGTGVAPPPSSGVDDGPHLPFVALGEAVFHTGLGSYDNVKTITELGRIPPGLRQGVQRSRGRLCPGRLDLERRGERDDAARQALSSAHLHRDLPRSLRPVRRAHALLNRSPRPPWQALREDEVQ